MERKEQQFQGSKTHKSSNKVLICFKCKTTKELFECEYTGTVNFPRIKVIICGRCKDNFPWNHDCIKEEKVEVNENVV